MMMETATKSAVFVTLDELLQLKKNSKMFCLSKLKAKNHLVGEQQTKLLARGMEFAESRRYYAGDDVRNIDWKVTARTGKAHTKLFTAERTRKVIVSIDMRSNMYFATKGVFKTVQTALIAANIGWHAALKGDQIGGLIFDENAFIEIAPRLGKKGLLPILHELENQSGQHHKSSVSEELKEAVLDKAIEKVKCMATAGTLCFIISDFRYLSSYAKSLLMQIALSTKLYLILVYDALEVSFPKNGSYPICDQNQQIRIDGYDKNFLEQYQKLFLERKKGLSELCSKTKAHFMECSTEEDALTFLKNEFR